MRTTILSFVMFAFAVVFFPADATAQQEGKSLPSGVTAEMVSEGATLYKGQGICAACHGPEGKGLPSVGANLADDEWAHSDGSYQGILESITMGVAPDKSTTGAAMPPKGGSSLNEAQLKAVAAYVWSLSRSK